MNDNLLTIFIAITAAAVLLQAGILVALYLAVRKTTSRLESIAEDVKTKAFPAIESAHTMLAEMGPKLSSIADEVLELRPKVLAIADNVVELRPKVNRIADNIGDVTTVVRDQVRRIDATVGDVTDRARLQVIRADELLTRTFDKVEQTSDTVQRTVMSPFRQVSGLIHGLSAGVEFFLHSRARSGNGNSRDSRRPVQQDEMFI